MRQSGTTYDVSLNLARDRAGSRQPVPRPAASADAAGDVDSGAPVSQELEQVELGHDAGGTPAANDQQGRRVP